MAGALLLVALWLSALAPGGPALAHAVLLETTPARGAILDAAPGEIALRFNEPVTPVAVSLVGRDGRTALPVSARDAVVHAPLPAPLPDGSYIVSYRVVSADSHPIAGAVLFIVGAATEAPPAMADARAGEEAAILLVIANRFVLLASLMIAAGAVLFAAAVSGFDHPLWRGLRRAVRIAAAAGIASAAVAVVLQGALLTGAFAESLPWREVVRVGWQSSLGTSAAATGGGLLLILAGFGRGGRLEWLALVGALLATGALAASGHAAASPPRWLAAPAMALHGATLCFWAGSLWPLRRALDLPTPEAAALVARFSARAVLAVGALLVSGLTLAVLQLEGRAAALVTTAYGQILLLKLGLVTLLMALAALNKIRLTPALADGDTEAALVMKRSIGLEIAVIGLIVAVTAVLGQTPPPRVAPPVQGGALHGGHAGHGAALPAGIAAESRGYRASVTMVPGHVGRNRLTVALRARDGALRDALEVTAEFSLPLAGIEPLAQPMRKVAPGQYQLVTDALIRPGIWQLDLAVLISDFEQVTFTVTFPVTAP